MAYVSKKGLIDRRVAAQHDRADAQHDLAAAVQLGEVEAADEREDAHALPDLIGQGLLDPFSGRLVRGIGAGCREREHALAAEQAPGFLTPTEQRRLECENRTSNYDRVRVPRDRLVAVI